MKLFKLRRWGAVGVTLGVLGICCQQAPAGTGTEELQFPVLQIGTQTYTNVTVTTKSKDYVFITHAAGMANFKVKDLSPEVRVQLGYVLPPPPKTAAATANDWAKKSLGKIETPQVKEFEEQFRNAWSSGNLYGVKIPPLTPKMVWIGVGGLVALYLFFCYCCKRICEKTGKQPSPLVWIPVLQVFPMFAAAGMSGWWFLALFVPLLNLVASVVWCVKIARACGKSVAMAIVLMLPILNVLGFLYLALSNGPRATKERRRVEIMTLEAA